MKSLKQSKRTQSISPDVKRIEVYSLNTANLPSSSRFSSTIEPNRIFQQDPENEYFSYITRTKNVNIKKNYSNTLDENIKKIKNFSKITKIQKELAQKEAIANEEKLKLKEKLFREEEDKRNAEKIRLEKERLKEELRNKEIIKEKGLKEWMEANFSKFEEKKKKIKKDLAEALEIQRQIACKKQKMNQARYQEILTNLETSRQISKKIVLVNIKRDTLLRKIQERDEKEMSEPLEKVIALDSIKERLSSTQVLDEINKCFEN